MPLDLGLREAVTLLWAVLKVVFDDECDPLVRLWMGFSWVWMFATAYFDSLRPDYNPKQVPPAQILFSIWPWIAGPVVFYAIRLLTTGSLRRPKSQ